MAGIVTTDEVKKIRPHMKFLSGDYLTYQKKFDQSDKGSPKCRLCELNEGETISHIVAKCSAYKLKRSSILEEMQDLCSTSLYFNMKDIPETSNPEMFTQFVLDPTSFNLSKRVNIGDPMAMELFRISRDMCNYTCTQRMKQLKELN